MTCNVMTLFHLHPLARLHHRLPNLASRLGAVSAALGVQVRVNQRAHQIDLTLSWRVAALAGAMLIGVVLSAVLLGIEDERELLLSTLSTPQVRAMPASPLVMDVASVDVNPAP